jgi:hypothetical protein
MQTSNSQQIDFKKYKEQWYILVNFIHYSSLQSSLGIYASHIQIVIHSVITSKTFQNAFLVFNQPLDVGGLLHRRDSLASGHG